MATNMDENYHQTWGIPSALAFQQKTLSSPTINPLQNGTASQRKRASILLPHKGIASKAGVDVPKTSKVVLDEKTEDLLKYLRKPDPLVTRNREHSISSCTLLTPINSVYIPESPGILPDRIDRTMFDGSSMLEPRLIRGFKKCNAPKLLPDNATLNLAILGKPLPGYDIGPLREPEHPPYSLDSEEDCERKCLAILRSELTGGELPPFKKELELNEKAEMVHWYDYALYKLFGIDRSGYFTLRAEKKYYQMHPWALLDQDSESENGGSLDESYSSELDDVEPGDETFDDFMQGCDTHSVTSLDRYLS